MKYNTTREVSFTPQFLTPATPRYANGSKHTVLEVVGVALPVLKLGVLLIKKTQKNGSQPVLKPHAPQG